MLNESKSDQYIIKEILKNLATEMGSIYKKGASKEELWCREMEYRAVAWLLDTSSECMPNKQLNDYLETLEKMVSEKKERTIRLNAKLKEIEAYAILLSGGIQDIKNEEDVLERSIQNIKNLLEDC